MLPILFQFRPFASPRHWAFVDPDTGFKFRAKDKESLVRHIVTYRAQNRLEPLEEVGVVIDTYLCGLPENAGKCTPIKKLKRGLWPTMKGGIALLLNYLYDKTVTQEEADRRSDICIKCKYNIFPEKGYLTKITDKKAEAMVGDKKAKNFDKLGNCEVCTCVLKAKVWFDGNPELDPEDIELMKEVNCWQPSLQAQYKSNG